MTPTEQFLPLLLEGDTDGSVALFAGQPDVDDPLSGRITHVFYFWAAARHMWLRDRNAVLEPVAVTRAGGRTVAEVVLRLQPEQGGRVIDLPVAVVGEEDGPRVRRVRVYHSTWPLSGAHAIRGPLLPPTPGLRAADVVGAYQEALRTGDVEGVIATLSPDAVVREPSGGIFTHAGVEGQRRFYGEILAGGGIHLEHNAIIDDGTTCALEYTATRWGTASLRPQAGVAVYVRGAGGRLAAARMYDDVEPPRPPPR
jgi:hypothetical protein